MKVPELVKALLALEDDENCKIAECEVMVYCADDSVTVSDAYALIDGECFVERVERDPDNMAPEVTIYFRKRES